MSWGRGALDDKGAFIAMLEAAEALIVKGIDQSERSISVLVMMKRLAVRARRPWSNTLKRQNVRFAWSLDEGSFVLDGIVPGLMHPVASINVAEKGYVTLVVVAKGRRRALVVATQGTRPSAALPKPSTSCRAIRCQVA